MLVSTKDPGLERTVNDVVLRFGGDFNIRTGVKWRRTIQDFKGTSVHLTMYGEKLDDVLPKLAGVEDLLIVVGAEKVPGDVYKHVNFNVGVGNQPHSEVAALAVFLDRLQGGSELEKEFNGELTVVPTANGKRMLEAGHKESPAKPI